MPRNRWKNQSGAFDLPSILVGVVVVGILTAGVFAAIFGVIPFAQDRAAKQDLASVSTAQGAAYTKDGGFLGKAGLVAAGLLGSGLPEVLDIRATADGECYTAVGTAGSGGKFITSSEETRPRALAPGDTWCDGTLVTPGPDAAPEPLPEEPVEVPAPEPEPEPTPDLEPVMISTWNTANCGSVILPVSGFKGSVDWGDGTIDSKTNHVYTVRGEVKIRIDGTFASWGTDSLFSWNSVGCLVSVDRWGATQTTDLSHAFDSADNLKHVESIPSTTVDLSYAFYRTPNLTLGDLDTSNVTTMERMFHSSAFNRPLDFDTSSVRNMGGMFSSTTAFNQPLNFDTSKVTTLGGMFSGTRAFNQPLNFDTSSVTSMATMFSSATRFNQPLNFTDTSKVTNMAQMFRLAPAFNQPLNFDTSSVTAMYSMFYHATAFNQDLSSWNVGKVTSRDNFRDGAASWTLPKPNFK